MSNLVEIKTYTNNSATLLKGIFDILYDRFIKTSDLAYDKNALNKLHTNAKQVNGLLITTPPTQQ